MSDEPNRPIPRSAAYEKQIAVLIWLAVGAIILGGLYACSILAGDPWRL